MAASKSFFSIACIGASILLNGPAKAQDTDPPMPPPGVMGVQIMPAKSLSTDQLTVLDTENVTDPELRLTPDKSEIVRLGQDAGSVIVGNPNHISVLANNTKTLVVVPKAPGATYFTVLDARGNVVMQRHVIVASPMKKYVRIRKACAAADGDCQPTQVYYCPDMCHEIIAETGDAKSSSSKQAQSITQGSTSSSAGGDSTTTNDENSAQPSTETGSDAVETP